jgi:hypothetical protein
VPASSFSGSASKSREEKTTDDSREIRDELIIVGYGPWYTAISLGRDQDRNRELTERTP